MILDHSEFTSARAVLSDILERNYFAYEQRHDSFVATFAQNTYATQNKQKHDNNCIWTLIRHGFKYTLKLFVVNVFFFTLKSLSV